MMIENYKSLCTIFYDADKPLPPLDEYLFYKFYLDQYKTDILEPMCGSGRFLIPFLKDGYDIDCFDASRSMLESLKNRLIKNNLFCDYKNVTFKDYVFKKKYNLIYIPSASISLIYDRKEFKKIIEKIYVNLNNGGMFIFEVETPEILELDKLDFKLIANRFIALDTRCKILGSFINHRYSDNILTISCRYDLIKNDFIFKTEFEDIIIRLFTYHEIIDILKNVGFDVIVYRDFNKNIYSYQDVLLKLLIIECKKN